MMGISEQVRMRALEKKVEELEARLAIVERADAYESAEAIVPRRKPGRPARKLEIEAAPAP
jgi:hypothetical protein